MSHSTREVPPPLELLCLKALWSLQEGSVKDVQGIVALSRPLAYTTIMTVLDRLVRKSKLTRRKVGRSFQYAATESRDTLRRAAVRELLDGFFDGSEAELLEYLRGARVEAPAVPQALPAPAEVAAAPEVMERRFDPVLL
jgi:predicted transcriptional regulator